MDPMNLQADRAKIETPKGAAFFMIGAVVLLWVLEIIDFVISRILNPFGNTGVLDQFGIHAWDPMGLLGIPFAPFLHAGFGHLASNSLPLLVLGFLILIGRGGSWRLLVSTVFSVFFSGLFAWFLTPAHHVIVGASGVVFGWLMYLILRGVFARDLKSIIISVVVLVIYGGVLWGVMPSVGSNVSWQAHLGGAIGGGLAAWYMHSRAKKKAQLV